MEAWSFADDPGTVSVTSADVTSGKNPILFVSHERDEDGEVVWQFHHDPTRFDFQCAQLVRLDTVFKLDRSIGELADLLIGWSATRASVHDAWKRVSQTV